METSTNAILPQLWRETTAATNTGGGGKLTGVNMLEVANGGGDGDGLSGVKGTSVGSGTGAGRQRHITGCGAVICAPLGVGANGSRLATDATHQCRTGGGGGKPSEPLFPSEFINLEVAMREKLQALERDTTMPGRAEAGGLEKEAARAVVLSSVFDTIIARSKTYGHLLATIKRHYEGICIGENGAAPAAASGDLVGRANSSMREELTPHPAVSGFHASGWAESATTFAAKLSVAEAHAAATKAKVKDAVKAADQRAAIATAAAIAAAQAQVAADAEAIRLTGENQRLRDDATNHVAAVAAATAEAEASHLARDSAIDAHAAAKAALDEVTTSSYTLEESCSECRRKIDDLNTVLHARTQDISQLGRIIISVYKGSIQPDQLVEIAAGMANILGRNCEGSPGILVSGKGGDGGGGGGKGGEEHREGNEEDVGLPTSPEDDSEEEDSSVPVDSAFYGVEADEVTWEEPLSVRENKPRPKGMPGLALNKLAPPSEDPDAAMLEFAYEQQYGKAEAQRMMVEAKAAEAAKNAGVH